MGSSDVYFEDLEILVRNAWPSYLFVFFRLRHAWHLFLVYSVKFPYERTLVFNRLVNAKYLKTEIKKTVIELLFDVFYFHVHGPSCVYMCVSQVWHQMEASRVCERRGSRLWLICLGR